LLCIDERPLDILGGPLPAEVRPDSSRCAISTRREAARAV
jgi:hypothetical protein